MRAHYWLIGALFSAPTFATTPTWFEGNSPLIQAHKHLLTNDLAAMFASLVEAWQLEKNATITPHLNELFLQSLQVDCGKGLDNRAFPDWIRGVTIRNTEIQSPGRDAYRVVVELNSSKEIGDINLTRWVAKTVSNDDVLIKSQPQNNSDIISYTKRYNLNNRLPIGLYRIDVTATDQTSWSAWLVLGESKTNMVVRWRSKDRWKIDKTALPNPHCPLPKLNASLYDYVDGTYNQEWTETYESDYPTSLKTGTVPPGRYVLAVSMTHQRWQGPLIVEQSQIISKTYDVSVEE
ncbi:DUF2861 family protein [Vibrio sinensis]|uniref:DUF2861 family protein n=1 Tax=Vibrio sinensis TaxID=2302434 RepID=A0A3A6QSY3_9VIBR|nr:DUF2861 family protein [Vibrio sinensis]RJX75483.1 DUF2861 family protein [Vibrio sinensis]